MFTALLPIYKLDYFQEDGDDDKRAALQREQLSRRPSYRYRLFVCCLQESVMCGMYLLLSTSICCYLYQTGAVADIGLI